MATLNVAAGLEPMKAKDLKKRLDWSAENPFEGIEAEFFNENYRLEPKIDGCGIFLTFGRSQNLVHSATRGISRTHNFPHLRDAVMPELEGTIIAAELLAWGEEPSGLLSKSVGLMVANPPKAVSEQKIHGPARLFVFDILQVRLGARTRMPSITNLTASSYKHRRRMLTILMKAWQEKYPGLPVYQVPSVPATGELLQAFVADGFEGGMLKGVASRYIPGSRSSGWFKVKINSTTDVVITGYEPGKDSNAGLVGSFEVSIMTSQGFRMVGHCGNFTDEFRAKISKPDGSLKDEYYMKVIEVSAQGVGARGHLRHCLFRRFRPDKAAHDCGPDQLAHLPAA
jgi:ATP-dependent DNA ligase